ncbi:WD40-repeat-containing domain protein [Amylostereum chailletii]|nr:WD40-repeat-containing domain protein [Amylostereum chailletii]
MVSVIPVSPVSHPRPPPQSPPSPPPPPPPPPSNSANKAGPPTPRSGPPPVMGRPGPPPPPFISGSNATVIGGGHRTASQAWPSSSNVKREDVPSSSASHLIPNARSQNGPPPPPSPLRPNGFHASNPTFPSPSYVREPSPPSWPPFLSSDASKRDATPDFDPPFRAGPSSGVPSANFTPIGTHRQNALGGYRPAPAPSSSEPIPIPTQASPSHMQGMGMGMGMNPYAHITGEGPEPYSPITSLRATMPPPTPQAQAQQPPPPPPPPPMPVSPSRSHPLPPKPPIPPHLSRLAPLRHASPLATPVRADPPRRPPPPPSPISTHHTEDRASSPTPTGGTKRKKTPTPEPESPVEYYGPPAMRTAPSTWPTVHPIRSTPMKGGTTDIRGIAFNSNGSFFAVYCRDSTIHIWDNVTHSEVARLTHSAPVVTVVWMDEDVGVISLCENGTVIKWTRPGVAQAQGGHWHCSKVAETNLNERAPPDVATAMAYTRDRVAVSFMRMGVKLWILVKGTWQVQRAILRQNNVALKFVEDGTALMGGTKDGVLWYSQVSGLMRAYAFFKTAVQRIEVTSSASHALVGQTGGHAHLVGIVQDENRGNIERGYMIKEPELLAKATYEFGATFVGKQERVVFGSTDGYVLVWDKDTAEILYGLDHGEGAVVQAVGVSELYLHI